MRFLTSSQALTLGAPTAEELEGSDKRTECALAWFAHDMLNQEVKPFHNCSISFTQPPDSLCEDV